MTNILETESLLCTEVFDLTAMKTPEKGDLHQQIHQYQQQQEDSHHEETFYPPTVRAVVDAGQVKDDRILQNMLRNEHKFLPQVPDYLQTVQGHGITASMRKTVADWMLEVVREQYSQPEVFCLAMNIMDRFLCFCQIHKSQLQLVGSVCILIASKIREPCPIPGKALITYTDYSITPEELKDWEILVLHKLQWELTAITSMDYLDHVIPRLDIDEVTKRRGVAPVDLLELRRRTETILVLLATDYQFSYHSQSLLAAGAIFTALHSLAIPNQQFYHDLKLRIQTATHTATNFLITCVSDINQMLPGFLKNLEGSETIPDSTSSPKSCPATPPRTCPSPLPSLSYKSAPVSPLPSPQPDLHCTEDLSNDSDLVQEFDHDQCCLSPITSTVDKTSDTSSPLSAVDLFSDFEPNALQVIFEQSENIDSQFSILVS